MRYTVRSLVLVSCFLLVVQGCDLISSAPTSPAIQVGELTLRRWDPDPQRYCLSLSLFNGTTKELTAFTLLATGTVAVDGAAGTGDTGDTSDTDVNTRKRSISLTVSCSVDTDQALPVELVFRTPFSFVPATPLELSDIHLASFRFVDGSESDGVIAYPYIVREE